MRLRQIEIFYAIYSSGSITAAARQLHISQPAVSKALRYTEDQLNFLLFERVGRRLVPTSEGHRLYEEASKVNQTVSSMRRAAHNMRRALSGHLRISSVTGLSFELLPRAIAMFRTKYPNITFELQTQHYGDLISSLRSYENDIGLVFSAPLYSGLQRLTLGAAEFRCVYTDGLLLGDAPRVALSDVVSTDYIAMNADGPLGAVLWSKIQEVDGWVHPIAIAESCFVAKSLAASGVGIAIVDEFTSTASGHENIKQKKIDPPITFDVHALHAQGKPLQASGQQFLESFVQVFEEYRRAVPLTIHP
ncbi:MAG: LysR family transcriptional regulator [Robiginitomaculum sp.]|nr:LysR family transcriptional regulator [Robiginitomaculum sp.]